MQGQVVVTPNLRLDIGTLAKVIGCVRQQQLCSGTLRDYHKKDCTMVIRCEQLSCLLLHAIHSKEMFSLTFNALIYSLLTNFVMYIRFARVSIHSTK